MTVRSPIILLAIDPSTTRTGYALMTSAVDVIDAGYLKPKRAKDPAFVRLDDMIEDLTDIALPAEAGQVMPTHGVIEVPSGKPGVGSRAGARASLAIYGFAAGAMWQCLQCKLTTRRIDEIEWTHGVPKAKRQMIVSAMFPAYRAVIALDTGGDVADAIGVGQYWFTVRERERSLKRAKQV